MWRMSSRVDVENERAVWMWIIFDEDICDRVWENQPVSEKNKFLFCCLLRRAKMPPSKFKANPTLRRGVKALLFLCLN